MVGMVVGHGAVVFAAVVAGLLLAWAGEELLARRRGDEEER